MQTLGCRISVTEHKSRKFKYNSTAVIQLFSTTGHVTSSSITVTAGPYWWSHFSFIYDTQNVFLLCVSKFSHQMIWTEQSSISSQASARPQGGFTSLTLLCLNGNKEPCWEPQCFGADGATGYEVYTGVIKTLNLKWAAHEGKSVCLMTAEWFITSTKHEVSGCGQLQ